VRWALVHCPDAARRLPYHDRCEVAWSAYGAYRTLLRERLPVAMLTDSRLEEGLGKECEVLFLPAPDRLTDAMRAAVAAFRERGGTVIEQRSDWRWGVDAPTFEYAADCVRRKLPDLPLLRISGGPERLHACTYASQDGKRIVVALAQDCSWIGVGRRDRAGDPPPPCVGVSVTLPIAPARVTEVVSGASLAPTGGAVEVPAFDALAVLVLEFGPK
jgi:hypothetical protein